MNKSKIIPALLTCCALALAPVMAQTGGSGTGSGGSTTGGSAGDGDKPLNPANKTHTGTDQKDSNGPAVTVHKPNMAKRHGKRDAAHSSAMSSMK